ncbi:MAG: hypothetical protein Kow00109_26740 [Acidobacteriota bacterium]
MARDQSEINLEPNRGEPRAELDPAIPAVSNPGDSPRKVLVVRLGSLGDIVHTLPATRILQRRHPSLELHWLCEPPWARFLTLVPWIHRVWVADTKGWRHGRGWKQAWKTLSELRRRRFDLVLDCQGLLKSALLARLVGGPVHGYARRHCREPLAAWFYDRAVTVTDEPRHMVERHADLFFPPRLAERPDPVVPLRISPAAEEWAVAVLERAGGESPVLLNLGGGWNTKRWDPRRFGDLARRLSGEHGIPCLLLHGPGEAALAGAAREVAGPAIPTLCPDLEQLIALLRRSRLMVAGDTGPLHLAVACGTPTVAILGPALPWRTGPYNPADEVVMHPRPCPRPYARRCRDHFCMDIPVEPVLAAVFRRLAKVSGDSSPATSAVQRDRTSI